MDSCLLPEDVIIDILQRLPVKSLIRFKCVNKTWRDFISSSYFTTRHLDFNKDKTLSYIRMSKFQMQLFTDGKDDSYLHLSFFGPTKYCNLEGGCMVGSSNGLVCLCEEYNRLSLIVWNPATGDFRRIPAPLTARRALEGGLIPHLAPLLAFDVRPCGDYRVVVILSVVPGQVILAIRGKNSDSWKIINPNVVPEEASYTADRGNEVVNLNGCMYYPIIETRNTQLMYLNVACFDMWEEKYRRISGPPCSRRSGRLGLVNGSSLGFFFDGEVFGTLDGWVMNDTEESWTKKYSIVPFTPVQFKSAEYVDMIMVDKRLRFYDHATKQFGSFPESPGHIGKEFCSFPKSFGQIGVCQYKESLFSVQKNQNPTT